MRRVLADKRASGREETETPRTGIPGAPALCDPNGAQQHKSRAMGAYGLHFVADPQPVIITAMVTLLAVYMAFLVAAR